MAIITDTYLRHAVQILRAQESEAEFVAAIARDINERALKELGRLTRRPGVDPNDPLRNTVTAQRELRKIILFWEALYTEEWDDKVMRKLNDIGKTSIDIETQFQTRTLEEFNTTVTPVVAPNVAAIGVVATQTPFDGRLLNDWSRAIGADAARRYSQILNDAFINGRSADDAARQIRRTDETITVQNSKTMARTYIQHNANVARDQVLTENSDILEARQWVSTLDNKTSSICAVRDGLIYNNENPNLPLKSDFKTEKEGGLPWLEGPGRVHFNCRSISVPKFKGVKDSGYRPAVEPGANYQKGDNTRTVRNTSNATGVSNKRTDPTPANRANKTYQTRVGDGDVVDIAVSNRRADELGVGQHLKGKARANRWKFLPKNEVIHHKRGVAASTKYEDWLDSQFGKPGGREFVQDVLGKDRAAYFEAGHKLNTLVDNNLGLPLTLTQLQNSLGPIPKIGLE